MSNFNKPFLLSVFLLISLNVSAGFMSTGYTIEKYKEIRGDIRNITATNRVKLFGFVEGAYFQKRHNSLLVLEGKHRLCMPESVEIKALMEELDILFGSDTKRFYPNRNLADSLNSVFYEKYRCSK